MTRNRIVERTARGGINLKPSRIVGDSGSEAGVTPPPYGKLPIPAFHKQGKGKSHSSEVGSGSNLDYSGGRKTHRFPPPNGFGSLSLTHHPNENPTGMMILFCYLE